jgi:pyruvate dehydrogenase phosphatase
MMGVFDGHGGWVLSQYINALLYPYFIEEYNSKSNIIINEEEKIIYSLKQSLFRIEEEFKLISFLKYKEGNKKYKNYGTCALISIIIDNKLYTATLGDSKARLFTKEENSGLKKYKYQKVSKVFNCRKKEEQKKLKEKWPNDIDIIKCKREKICYVKGRLQPTSSLGDYYLKNVFFNINYKNINNDKLIEKQIKSYKGPYIEYIPDIQIFDLNNNDKYLIIGSDGLWDYLSSKDISKLLADFIEDKNNEFYENKIFWNSDKIAFGLLEKVIEKSAKKNNLEPLMILDIPLGKRLRRIHDDITIIICDLSNIS